jgi:hypothetical protein
VCVAPPRPAEHCRCRLKLTPHTLVDLAKKPLQEHSRSCKASRARPRVRWRGPTDWHQQPGGRMSHQQASTSAGATVGESHKGPLNNQGKPAQTRKKINANEPKYARKTNPRTHDPSRNRPSHPQAELRSARGEWRCPDTTPPRSWDGHPLQRGFVSLEVQTTPERDPASLGGWTPPLARGSASVEGRAPPRASFRPARGGSQARCLHTCSPGRGI